MSTAGALSVVVVHEASQVRLALIRDLRAQGMRARGVAVLDEAAIEALATERPHALLVHWALPDDGAPILMVELAERLGRRAPFVLAFRSAWAPVALRQALQLNVLGIHRSPVDAAAVARDLAALRRRDDAPSVARLLDQAGAALLTPDAALWGQVSDPDWVDRLIRFAAEQSRRRRVALGLEGGAEQVDPATLEGPLGPFMRADEHLDGRGLRTLYRDGALEERMDEAEHDRLAALRTGAWEHIAEHMRRVELEPEFQEALDACRYAVDYRRATERLPAPPLDMDNWTHRESTRMRLLAALWRHADEDDREVVFDHVAARHGDRIDAATGLRAVLQGEGDEAGVQALRRHLGLPIRIQSAVEIESLIQRGEFDLAYFAITEMRDDDPRAIFLMRTLDDALSSAGRMDAAERFYVRAVRRAGNQAAMLKKFVHLKLKQGERERALELAIKVQRMAPSDPELNAIRDALVMGAA